MTRSHWREWLAIVLALLFSGVGLLRAGIAVGQRECRAQVRP